MGAIGYFTTLIFGFVLMTGKETVTSGLLYPVSKAKIQFTLPPTQITIFMI